MRTHGHREGSITHWSLLGGNRGVIAGDGELGRNSMGENCLNPGGGGCGEPRLHHCTPVWVTRAKLRLKKKKNLETTDAGEDVEK